jgi:hypothetical protein
LEPIEEQSIDHRTRCLIDRSFAFLIQRLAWLQKKDKSHVPFVAKVEDPERLPANSRKHCVADRSPFRVQTTRLIADHENGFLTAHVSRSVANDEGYRPSAVALAWAGRAPRNPSIRVAVAMIPSARAEPEPSLSGRLPHELPEDAAAAWPPGNLLLLVLLERRTLAAFMDAQLAGLWRTCFSPKRTKFVALSFLFSIFWFCM